MKLIKCTAGLGEAGRLKWPGAETPSSYERLL